MNSNNSSRRVLAISSRGGHWVELVRLREAFAGHKVTYVTTVRQYKSMIDEGDFRVVTEATRDTKVRLAILAFQVLWILLRVRPAVIVTTGAAPGFIAVWIGRRLGIRTLWLDCMANAEELSLSGQLALKHTDHFLTQWEHLQSERVEFHGSIVPVPTH